MIEEAKALACQAALEIPEVGHVGWDMAIGPDGPAIIEGNDFPARTCASWPPSARRKPACGPIIRSFCTCK